MYKNIDNPTRRINANDYFVFDLLYVTADHSNVTCIHTLHNLKTTRFTTENMSVFLHQIVAKTFPSRYLIIKLKSNRSYQ